MNKRKENFKKASIFGGIILVGILGMLYKNYMHNQPQDYTIGTVEKIWKPVKGGKKVKFVYKVADQEYNGNVNYFGYESVAKPGKRFLVEFPEDYAWEGIMILDFPIPDGVEAPSLGWQEKPSF